MKALLLFILLTEFAHGAGLPEEACGLAHEINSGTMNEPERLARLEELRKNYSHLRPPPRSKSTIQLTDTLTVSEKGLQVRRKEELLIESGYVDINVDGGYDLIDRKSNNLIHFSSKSALLSFLKLEVKETEAGLRLIPLPDSAVSLGSTDLIPRAVQQELVAYEIDQNLNYLILPQPDGVVLVRPDYSTLPLGELVGRYYTARGVMFMFRNGENTHYVQLVNDGVYNIHATQNDLFSTPNFLAHVDKEILRDAIAHSFVPKELIPEDLKGTVHPLGLFAQ